MHGTLCGEFNSESVMKGSVSYEGLRKSQGACRSRSTGQISLLQLRLLLLVSKFLRRTPTKSPYCRFSTVWLSRPEACRGTDPRLNEGHALESKLYCEEGRSLSTPLEK